MKPDLGPSSKPPQGQGSADKHRTTTSGLQPDIRVKPPGSTTPADVFSTVPLVVEDDCQGGVLVCTCMDTVDEEEDEEEEDGVDCVVPGKLDTVNAGLISSCRQRRVSPSAFSCWT